MNSRSSLKLGTQKAGTDIAKAGGGCRVRRWEARSTSGTMTESHYENVERSVRGGSDISLPC